MQDALRQRLRALAGTSDSLIESFLERSFPLRNVKQMRPIILEGLTAFDQVPEK